MGWQDWVSPQKKGIKTMAQKVWPEMVKSSDKWIHCKKWNTVLNKLHFAEARRTTCACAFTSICQHGWPERWYSSCNSSFPWLDSPDLIFIKQQVGVNFTMCKQSWVSSIWGGNGEAGCGMCPVTTAATHGQDEETREGEGRAHKPPGALSSGDNYCR